MSLDQFLHACDPEEPAAAGWHFVPTQIILRIFDACVLTAVLVVEAMEGFGITCEELRPFIGIVFEVLRRGIFAICIRNGNDAAVFIVSEQVGIVEDSRLSNAAAVRVEASETLAVPVEWERVLECTYQGQLPECGRPGEGRTALCGSSVAFSLYVRLLACRRHGYEVSACAIVFFAAVHAALPLLLFFKRLWG
jgi:hypothetical protein